MAIFTFDIETLGWDSPIAVGLYDGKNRYIDFLKKGEEDDLIWRFLQYVADRYAPVNLYAHYSSHFDNKFILNALIEHKQKIALDSGLGVLKWLDKRISFIDSHLLLRTSLRKACEMFNIPNKLSWDHTTTIPIYKMDYADRSIFRDYLERDCRSLSAAYSKFAWEIIDTFSIPEPSYTLAQTSLKVFNTYYPLEEISSNPDFHWAIRESLYGARNEIYSRYGEDINLYDIRSMYVSCYDIPVPIGEMKFRSPKMEEGTLAEAIVTVPEDWYIGPLPLRHERRLIFPVGRFKGWWDMVELRYAESLGCKVELKRQIESKEEPILKDFGERICDLRSGSKGDLTRLWKALGLQLVGKFAQSRARSYVKHAETLTDLEGWTPLTDNEEYFEGERKVTKGLQSFLLKTVKPAITMRIRAEARIRHHKILLEAMEGGNIFYCDTDSIYCNATLSLGQNPGELQEIGTASRAYFIMSKFYGFVQYDGTIKQRSSGFSGVKLREEDFQNLLEGKSMLLRQHSPTFSSNDNIIGGEKVKARSRIRTIRTPLNNQNRIIEGHETRPIVVHNV